jgi:hypothetical protein
MEPWCGINPPAPGVTARLLAPTFPEVRCSVIDRRTAMQVKNSDSFYYAERSFFVYPNREGSVTLRQEYDYGPGGVTILATFARDEVAELVTALLGAKQSLASPETDSEYIAGEYVVYASEGGNVCIVADAGDDEDASGDEAMVFEPHRVDALIAALQKAAAEADQA